MERGRVAKPKEAATLGTDEGSSSQYYLSGDLWIGAKVDFNSHRFILIDCDEYALRYMEAHPSQVSYIYPLFFLNFSNYSIRLIAH